MMRRVRERHREADLDITSFMNLMIILVPVLLMSMVFSHISVLDLKLPGMSASDASRENSQKQTLELVIHKEFIDVNFPQGVRLKRIGKIDKVTRSGSDEGKPSLATTARGYDFALLSNVLQEVKRRLKEKKIDKRDILVLSQADTDYQTLVSVMDTVRSFKTVVAASVVDAELFPDISLGDAPVSSSVSSPVSSSAGDQVASLPNAGGAS